MTTALLFLSQPPVTLPSKYSAFIDLPICVNCYFAVVIFHAVGRFHYSVLLVRQFAKRRGSFQDSKKTLLMYFYFECTEYCALFAGTGSNFIPLR